MAKIICKANGLEERYEKAKKNMTLGGFGVFFTVIAALFLISQAAKASGVALALWLIPTLGVVFLFAYCMSLVTGTENLEILRNGMEGEQSTQRLIEMLPEGYRGYCNVVVPFEGKESELDMVVTGPTGVFIIETKHLNGTVCGNYDQEHWQLHKVGRQGGQYSKDLYSPVKQVRTHTFRLAGYLRSRGCGTFVKDAVYFSSSGTYLELTGDNSRTPAFSCNTDGGMGLIRFITGQPNQIPAPVLKKINATLDNL